MTKEELRKHTIETLHNISDTEKKEIETKLYQYLFHSDYWKNADTIAVTISRGFEWETRPIIEEGWKQGKTMVAPKCCPDERKLIFYTFHRFDELETVYYGLLEPKPIEQNKKESDQIDLVIVPGVVFARDGYRIGFGGGYYDRFLSGYQGQTLSIFSMDQLVDHVPTESHDIPVKHMITENGWVK